MLNPRSCTRLPTPMRHDDRLIGRDFAQACADRGGRNARASRARSRSPEDGKNRSPGFLSRLITLSHIDQLGSIRTLTSFVWIRNDAWPIQVMQISPAFTFGKSGRPPFAGALGEERRDEDAGEEVPLMPVRSRPQPDAGGRSVVADFRRLDNVLRLFLEKGIGTPAEPYKLAGVNQTFRRDERRR